MFEHLFCNIPTWTASAVCTLRYICIYALTFISLTAFTTKGKGHPMNAYAGTAGRQAYGYNPFTNWH
jgi:hypothetical protein